ncbi:DNA starvation/stationary phase protection protein [Aquibacillus koreensis]|uniref:DNA starvation/stationary phase protection protein n=1 Tax=Aquibacillus koreensis TaxID=279446 RepID=A0A9X3WQ05_9BACI|nr:Dps family protein [Aquibacillus koreensis]MCT2536773.1 DNA starvation/stationary phase protection protein [Aquibacillus koreensis]MDC3421471.1 DNA starvation/stationary phase protection protein [Aquibacillus koreensis]
MENKQLIDELNMQLANWNILYTKLHNYHWYVTGPEFFTLHEKFEELYTEAAGYVDEIAERILTIGGKPLATLKDYLNHASIEEATGSEDPQEMVTSLVNDFDIITGESKDVIHIAEETNDEVTADMFTGIRVSLEKHVWMFRAYLN